MTGAANADHDEITAFCEDFTADLTKISVPVLVMHGEDDQVVNHHGATVGRAGGERHAQDLTALIRFPEARLPPHAAY